jgi:hypothetical protein
MEIITLECDYCHILFDRQLRKYTRDINQRKQKSVFCSAKCQGDAVRKTMTMNCSCCNKPVIKKLAQVKKSKSGKVFCDRSCAATYHNLNKTTGCRRSKLEVYIETQIQLFYPELGCLYNSKEIINSELDFYFPTLKLAIELNGIFHYEPIYGPSKLEQIQNNDKQKTKLCLDKGIELCVIDSSQHKNLTQSQKDKYWSIVNQLIQQLYQRHFS